MENESGNLLLGKMTVKSTLIFCAVCFVITVGIILFGYISYPNDSTDILGTYFCELDDGYSGATITIVLNDDNECSYTFLSNQSGATPSTTEYCNFEVADGKVLLTSKFRYADEFTNEYTLYPYGEYMIQDIDGCFFDKIKN